MGFENRSFLCEVRAEENEDTGTQIIGRPIVFENKTNLGYFDEVIRKGALDKTDLSDVRFLVNHNLNCIPLARARKGDKNSTMQIDVDNKGMTIKVSLDTENNSEARALYSAVKRGDISGMSFMFRINGEEWDDVESDHPTRYITDISVVLEVSAVTFPAYQSTEIQARNINSETNENILKNARSKSIDSELELEKLKAKYLYKI